MRKFHYYARPPGSDEYVTIEASSWQEAQRIAAEMRDELDQPFRVGAHEMGAPSWNDEEPPAPKARHPRLVPDA